MNIAKRVLKKGDRIVFFSRAVPVFLKDTTEMQKQRDVIVNVLAGNFVLL